METLPNRDQILCVLGYDFPRTSKELKMFNTTYFNYSFSFNEEQVDPEIILKRIKAKQTPKSNIDYHKRLVLAAEVVYRLHSEPTLGHVKLQKLIYLCQNIVNIDVPTNYLKQAMGPYDPHLMRSIDNKLEANKWFKYTPNQFPQYKPMENMGGHSIWYSRYFGDQNERITTILDTFGKVRSEKVELVATIHSCYTQAKEHKQIINEESIVKLVYDWSKEKEKFQRDRIIKAYRWMIENKYI